MVRLSFSVGVLKAERDMTTEQPGSGVFKILAASRPPNSPHGPLPPSVPATTAVGVPNRRGGALTQVRTQGLPFQTTLGRRWGEA